MSKNNFIRDDIQFFLPVTESNHLAKARFQCKREKKESKTLWGQSLVIILSNSVRLQNRSNKPEKPVSLKALVKFVLALLFL